MMISASSRNYFSIPEPTDPTTAPGNRNIDGKVQQNPLLIGGVKRAAIVFFGQSNSGANYAEGAYSTVNPGSVFNFNIYNGGLYQATAPLVGAGGPPTLVSGGSGGGETWLIRYADKLIAGTTCDRVVLVPASISSTTAAQWAVGGLMNPRIQATAARIAATAGLTVSGVIYAQGESDNANGTSQAAYAASLSSIISTINTAFPGVPVFIPQMTYYLGTTSTAVRAAQAAAVNNTTVFSLGDFDTVGAGGRWDNIHTNATGSDSFATLANTNSAAHLTIW